MVGSHLGRGEAAQHLEHLAGELLGHHLEQLVLLQRLSRHVERQVVRVHHTLQAQKTQHSSVRRGCSSRSMSSWLLLPVGARTLMKFMYRGSSSWNSSEMSTFFTYRRS